MSNSHFANRSVLHQSSIGEDDRPVPMPVSAEKASILFSGTAAGPSPSQADEIAFLNGIDASGRVAATSFATWNGKKVADYLSHSDTTKWGGDMAGTSGGTVNYYFKAASNWTSTEKGVIQSALALWESVADIHFNLVTSASQADLTFRRGSDGSAYEFDSHSDAGGKIGSKHLHTTNSSTVSVDTSVKGFGPMDGSFTKFGGYVWGTIIHEIGHALGLGHAGPYNGDVNPVTQQYSAYDSLAWTIMSYIEPKQNAKYSADYPVHSAWGVNAQGYSNTPTTIMSLDILAVQQLYGAATNSPLSGGQVYGFHTNITGDIEKFFDFNTNTKPIVTLFNFGTGNTLNLSGFSTATTVDLHAGTFSSCAGLTNNICIAYDTAIDGFVGSSGKDTVVGNDDGDTMNGGKGNDVLTGGAGNDSINGGKGNDTINGGAGADTLTVSSGNDTLVYTAASQSTGAGFDIVKGFDFQNGDKFDLPVFVTSIHAAIAGGTLGTGGFDGALAALIGAGQMHAHQAVLFTPDHGSFAGDTFLIVDANGIAGYQAGTDFVFRLDGAAHLSSLDKADFV